LGSIHGDLDTGEFPLPGLILISYQCSSSCPPNPPSGRDARNPSSSSLSSYSPNLVWLCRACGKTLGGGCWCGIVNRDWRSSAQVLRSKHAPITMVPLGLVEDGVMRDSGLEEVVRVRVTTASRVMLGTVKAGGEEAKAPLGDRLHLCHKGMVVRSTKGDS
jgi:hypothetical protein